jgi:hypothetical protein
MITSSAWCGPRPIRCPAPLELHGTADVVEMSVGEQDLLTVMPTCLIAARCAARRPDRPQPARRLVRSSVQFCWNGVTGIRGPEAGWHGVGVGRGHGRLAGWVAIARGNKHARVGSARARGGNGECGCRAIRLHVVGATRRGR